MRCNANKNLGPSASSGVGSKGIAVAGFTLVEILAIVAILAMLARIGVIAYQKYKNTARNHAAMDDLRIFESEIITYKVENGSFPDALSQIPSGNKPDPWGHPYQYLNIADGAANWQGKCRRDRSLNPLNTDFDLYSMGADGQTQKQLTAGVSLDDIVRANNGTFLGLAADF
jgi:general secretion pathway protein G